MKVVVDAGFPMASSTGDGMQCSCGLAKAMELAAVLYLKAHAQFYKHQHIIMTQVISVLSEGVFEQRPMPMSFEFWTKGMNGRTCCAS
jgi:hypothetical protein